MADSGIENKNDYVSLRVDLPEDESEITRVRELLAGTGPQRSIHIELSHLHNYAVSVQFLRVVVAFLANEAELENLRKRNGDYVLELTEEEQTMAVKWVIASLDAQVHSWPTPFDQDDRLLKDHTLSGSKFQAVSFRRTVKSLIQQAAHRLRTAPIIEINGRPNSPLDWALATIKVERRGDGVLAASA